MTRRVLTQSIHTSFAICSLFLIAACESETQPVEEQDVVSAERSIESIADEVLAAMLVRNPAMATSFAIEGARHDRLYDNSLQALDEWQTREDVWLKELDAIGEPTDVGSRDWVTFGILREQLAASQAVRICHKELWETSTTTAWYTGMPFIFDIQPLESDDLKQQALARLGEVDRFIDNEVSNLKKGLEMGYSSPRLTVVAVPDEVRALRDDNSPFLAMGARAEDEVFEGDVRTIFNEEIIPAINRYADFIEGEYLEQAREEIAISGNPDGAACYPALVRSFATIQPTADEIHELGLAQMNVEDPQRDAGNTRGALRGRVCREVRSAHQC